MSRELADIQDLKSAFVSHCRALGCEDNYIKVCENKFDKIETALKRLEKHDKIFNEYEIDDNWLDIALYVIKNHFPMDTETQLNKIKSLDIIKELFDFDFALRFGSNQPMLMIINKKTNEYWELPISKDKWDLLKEEILHE